MDRLTRVRRTAVQAVIAFGVAYLVKRGIKLTPTELGFATAALTTLTSAAQNYLESKNWFRRAELTVDQILSEATQNNAAE